MSQYTSPMSTTLLRAKTIRCPKVPPAPPKEIDRKIADYILKEIVDGATLQLGIGGLPNLIGQLIAEERPDTGIHTEMMVDSMVSLYESGRVTGRKKNIDRFKIRTPSRWARKNSMTSCT